MVYLQPVALTDGREFYEMLQHIGPDENGFINPVNGMEYARFSGWLKKQADMAQGIGLEDWMVPASTYWLMADGIPVGKGNLRHRLTEALAEAGGHIGYAVDSTQRGKGYGKALLRLLLEEAGRIDVAGDILVTIRPDNIASRRVAEACGGKLRRETAERTYYWFTQLK